MTRPTVSVADAVWDVGVARIPVHLLRPADREAGPPVLFLHGFNSASPPTDPEPRSLAAAGFTTILVEAPHHGARRSTLVDAIVEAHGPSAHELFLRIVREAVAELPPLVDRVLRECGGPVGVVGISMGAYTALAGAAREPRLAAIVSLLGSPDWTPPNGEPTPATRTWLSEAPIHRPGLFPPRALLLGNGGRDVNVRPDGARAFAAALRPFYADRPDRFDYREYPESAHFMREDDWNDLWARSLDWLRRHLGLG